MLRIPNKIVEVCVCEEFTCQWQWYDIICYFFFAIVMMCNHISIGQGIHTRSLPNITWITKQLNCDKEHFNSLYNMSCPFHHNKLPFSSFVLYFYGLFECQTISGRLLVRHTKRIIELQIFECVQKWESKGLLTLRSFARNRAQNIVLEKNVLKIQKSENKIIIIGYTILGNTLHEMCANITFYFTVIDS